MPKQHTINLASSEDMVLVLLGRITDVLGPLAKETGLDATFDITREDDLTTINVTVPDGKWELALIRGIADAIYEHQDIVYVSGWESLCEKLLRIPWFRPLAAESVEMARPKWSPPTTDKLSEVFSLPEVNRMLCSWIFVSNVVHAVTFEFEDAERNEPDKFKLVHPEVIEEFPYLLYARAVTAWCENIRLPHHLIVGAKHLMDHTWQPRMHTWVLGLRPDIRCEVMAENGGYLCQITASRSILTLLNRALLFIGNLVAPTAQEYMTVLRVNPDMAGRVYLNRRNPDATMDMILAATFTDIGFKLQPALNLSEKPALTFNNYGQTYLTIAASTPVDETLLHGLRVAAKGAHDAVLAGHNSIR